jgi:hypothetical protein
MSLRPLPVSEYLSESIDFMSISIMGFGAIASPKYSKSMEDYKYVPLDSTFNDNANIDIWNYIRRIHAPVTDKDRIEACDYMRILMQATCISAFEMIKELQDYRIIYNEPIIQFMRHIRNASAHRNYFNLHSNEPKSLAKWRDKRITRDLNGTECFFKYLAPGDVPMLFSDVSNLIGGRQV